MRRPKVMLDLKAGDVLHYHGQLFLLVEDPAMHEEYANLVVVRIFNLTYSRREKITTSSESRIKDTYQDVTVAN